MLNVGRMRHVLEVQTVTTTVNPTTGKREEVATTVEKIWADVSPITKRDAWQFDSTEVKATHEIKCRFSPNINNKTQFKWGSRILRVSKIRNVDERSERLEVVAWELTSE